jgi:hypothetical protein
MDFFFQTPMIFLTKTLQPYLYFYNLPFIISPQTQILINNKIVNIILPLNSNQFFILLRVVKPKYV